MPFIPRPRRYYGWTILDALGVTTIVSYGTTQYLFALLVPPLTAEFGWSRAQLGLAFSGTVLLAAVCGPAFGHLVDRFGARVPLALGSLLGGASLLALSRIHALGELIAVWTLGLGVASALTYYPVTFTVIANWFGARRGAALARLTFWGAFASPVFVPLAGMLIAALGWRGAVAVLGLLQLAIALPLHAVVVRRRPEDLGLHPDGATAAPLSAPESGLALREALRTGAFWTLSGALSLSAFASTTLFVQQAAYLVGAGYPERAVAFALGLFGLAYLPGRALVAWAHGRTSAGTQLAIVLALEAVAIALLATTAAWPAALGYVATFGFAYGALAPIRGELVAAHFGRRAYGAIAAAQGVPIAAFAALGPIVSGRLVDARGYHAAFAACIVALVLGAGLALASPRGRPESSAAATK